MLMGEEHDGGSDRYIVHIVMLDDDLSSAFRSTSKKKADTAAQMLIAAFGHDRVSMTSFGESDLDEYQRVVGMWAADPRLQNPQP